MTLSSSSQQTTPARDLIVRTLVFLSGRTDLVIALLMVVAVTMMIVPLPTGVVDVLIATNISASVLVLLVAFYLKHPTQFSSLPAVILMTTLFRLSITITTSRLILLQADAGEVVNAFGSFVIGGNIAVGLVIFLIISIAQFVVITKGAERVAEVAARFSLDGLPGKQMSIDNDLRNGDITQPEARALRRRLENESQLYGAMDGAMKFVKGDAIASLIIIVVNLIGGFAIGALQRGMTLGAAAETYSLLTVGDGLVAQIPALLVSVAAGTVVTHVTSEEHRDLGSAIVGEMARDSRALLLAASIVLGLSFVPGFPTPVFIVISVILALSGYLIYRRAERAAEAQRKQEEEAAMAAGAPSPALEAPEAPQPPSTPAQAADTAGALEQQHPIIVWVGHGLARSTPYGQFSACVNAIRRDLHDDLAVSAPSIDLRVDQSLPPDRFRIELDGVPAAEGETPTGCLLVKDDPAYLDIIGVPYRTHPRIPGRRQTVWVDADHETDLISAGVAFDFQLDVLTVTLTGVLRRHASQFVGLQETHRFLTDMVTDYPELVKEALTAAPLQKIGEVLRRLVDENVPIKNMRLILEAIAEWGPREQDAAALAEYVRMALGRIVCFRYANGDRVIAAYGIERSVEEALRSSIHATAVGAFLSAPDDTGQSVLDQIRRLDGAGSPGAQASVVLTAMDLRRHVRNLLTRNGIDLAVLSYQELSPEFSVQTLGFVKATPAMDRQITDKKTTLAIVGGKA